MTSYPPHRTKVSNVVSQDVALGHLTAYLTSSETQPHLLPNAHLDPSTGPTIRSSNFSVTIHNLRRVQAGLRGEILAPALELNDASGIRIMSRKITEEVAGKAGEKQNFVTIAIGNEETHISDNISNSEQISIPIPEINDLDQVIEQKKTSSLTPIDKEARKREKKLRRKELKKTQRDAIDV